MNEPWFHAPGPLASGMTIELDREEARHATGARRLAAGDDVILFDGAGTLARASIASINKRGREVLAEVHEVRMQPAPSPALTVATALPKGDRLAVMLSMLVQLGVNAIRPLECARGVVRVTADSPARWCRIMLEACKQSRRARVPEILPALGVTDAARCALESGGFAWIAHPTGRPVRDMTPPITLHGLTLLIGPEGGFTEEEVESALLVGASAVSLGDGILRIETAAVALLAAIRLTG